MPEDIDNQRETSLLNLTDVHATIKFIAEEMESIGNRFVNGRYQ